MFGIILTISVVLVVIAVAMYRVHPAAVLAVYVLVFVVSIPFFSFSVRSLYLIYPALLLVWTVCRLFRAPRGVFSVAAALAVAGVWGLAVVSFLPQWKETQRLARRYPVVRIDERLAYERTAGFAPRGKAAEDERGAGGDLYYRIETAERGDGPRWESRGAALASLERVHDDFAEAFAKQQGFGIERIAFNTPPLPEYIEIEEPEPLAQAQPPSVSAGESSDPPGGPRDPGRLADYHAENVVGFVNPRGFGYALDRGWTGLGYLPATRVRGFQSHAFRASPGPPPEEDWQLAKLELVSLLKHDPPAVYVSGHLPRMQELSSDAAPTRPLDAFESASLARLLDGETVVAGEGGNRLRMLGGLRAAVQCTQCHSVGEGYLLGAFSYEFRRRSPLPPEPRQAPKPVL